MESLRRERRNEQIRQWFATHPNYHRDWYRRNPEKGRKKATRWRAKQRRLGVELPRHDVEYMRRWRNAHRKEQLAYFGEYRKRKRYAIRASQRNYKARLYGAPGSFTGTDVLRQFGEVIDMHGIALRAKAGPTGTDITVSTLLSSKTKQGRVDFELNGEGCNAEV